MEMSPSQDFTLSVVIPAYNEEARILPTLDKINLYKQTCGYPVEVIVVDDCSQDRTNEVVRHYIADKPDFRLIKNEFNSGKGASVRAGVAESDGRYVLFSDADMSTPIEEVGKLMDALKDNYQVAIGSRRLKGAHLIQRQPILREAAGRVFSVLVRFITLPGFLDTQCGFKIFTREAAREIFRRQTIEGFGFDVEILYIAVKKLGLKVKEVPVIWMDSPATRVRMFRDSTLMFLDLIRIRVHDHDRKYD